MPNFEYPSGLWPSGMALPTERVGFSQSFEATSGTLSSQQGMVYPIAVPRIDGGEASGLQHYVPYSAQLFGAAMENIKKEYEQRGATEPTFYAYFDSSGTIKEEITSYTDLYSMPLTNFHMTIRDCYTAISGLVEMDDWGDDMTDYMRRVFDYRVLLKDVPKENRLQDSVTYYNTRLGQEVTIDPLTRARAGQFPLSLDDVKYLGSKWGVDPSGTRRYGSDDFGGSGIAASPGSGLFPTGDRDPEFSNSNFMGHFDWLIQSIMWRGPFVETFSKTESSSSGFFNFTRGIPSDEEIGDWDSEGYTGRRKNYPEDNIGQDEVDFEPSESADYHDYPINFTYYAPTVYEIDDDLTTINNTYNMSTMPASGTIDYDIVTHEIGVSGIDHGDVTLLGATCVRNFAAWKNRRRYEAGSDSEVKVFCRNTYGFNTEIFRYPNDVRRGLRYEDSNVQDNLRRIGIHDIHANEVGYDEFPDENAPIAAVERGNHQYNILMLPVFEEVAIEKFEGGISVKMKDWFGSPPSTAYGSFSGHVFSSGPSVPGINDPAWSVPVARGGFGRLSSLHGDGFTIPAKTDPTPQPFVYFGNPNTNKQIHFSGTDDNNVNKYVLNVFTACGYKWGRQWNYWNQMAGSKYSRSQLSGWVNNNGTTVLTFPFHTFENSTFGVKDIDNVRCQPANFPGGGLLYNVTSNEYDSMFSDYVDYSASDRQTPLLSVEYGPSGYTKECYHVMQSAIEIKKARSSVSGYSYPIGKGSQAIVDVSMDNRGSIPADFTSLVGREDWAGLHMCLTTSKHIPDMVETSGSRTISVHINPHEYKGDYTSQEEGYIVGAVDPSTRNKLGFWYGSYGIETDYTRDIFALFDGSGRLIRPDEVSYKNPKLINHYWTRGAAAMDPLPKTEMNIYLTEEPYLLRGPEEDDPETNTVADEWEATHKDIPGYSYFDDKKCYVLYGDQNIINNEFPYFFDYYSASDYDYQTNAIESWKNYHDSGDASEIPSGIHYSTWKFSDYSPSGSVYTLDLWSRFRSDMQGIESAASGGWFGGAGLGDDNVLSLSSSSNNMNLGFGSIAGESAPSGHDPAFGIKDDNSEGAELINMSFVDLAVAQENANLLGENGTGYTLRSIRLKFPIILGPDGVE